MAGGATLALASASLYVVLALARAERSPSAVAASGYRPYIDHFLVKYGNADNITVDGLERLMLNLRLGGNNNDATSTAIGNGWRPRPNANDGEASNRDGQDDGDGDEPTVATVVLQLNEMHPRHPRKNDDVSEAPLWPIVHNVCLTPTTMLRLIANEDDNNNVNNVNNTNDDDDDDENRRPLHRPAAKQTHDRDPVSVADPLAGIQLTPGTFVKLCPVLLAQLDEQVCAQRAPPPPPLDGRKDALANAWIFASACILTLSCCGLLGVLLVPLMRTVAYHQILNFLVAVAVGTLSGDALMHLLPHAITMVMATTARTATATLHHDDGHARQGAYDDHRGPVWICACAFFTAVTMFVLEKLLSLVKQPDTGHPHHHHQHYHYNHYNHNHEHQQQQQHGDGGDGGGGGGGNHDGHLSDGTMKVAAMEPTAIDCRPTGDAKELNVMLNELQKDPKAASPPPLSAVAFMVMVGDGLHNLTDGLAIGAAFAADPVTGLATAFAVLCHELPHELGDFALLLQAGVSLRRALYLNAISSVLSFVGMAIGLLIAGSHAHITRWIYAGTAGSFLYIAFSDLLPAMAATAAHSDHHLQSALVQILGILVGGLIMLLIALNEDQLVMIFQ